MIFKEVWQEFKQHLGWREMETEMQEALGLAVTKLVQGEKHDPETDAFLRGIVYGISQLHDFEPEFHEEREDDSTVPSTGVSDSGPTSGQDRGSESVKRTKGPRLHG